MTELRAWREELPVPAGADGAVWHFRPPHRRFAAHYHDELEFNLVRHGTGRYLLRDRTYRLSPGDIVWLFPQQTHVLVDHSPDCRIDVAVFRPELAARASRDAGVQMLREKNPAERCIRRLMRGDRNDLLALIRLVDRARGDRAQLNSGFAHLLHAAWAAYARATEIDPDAVLHEAVSAAAALLRARPELGRDELASLAGMSAPYLSRLFAEQLGTTITTYRTQQRLDKTLQLVRDGMNMAQAAAHAGFGSYAQFYRCFRDARLQTPREFLRSHAAP